jgi:2-(1,2-epoxy-1,2-dihydrophenyl)acetyl-CoA isomerase
MQSGSFRGFDLVVHAPGIALITFAEALDLGLGHEVVPSAALLPRALECARELAEGPQGAMRMLKRSIYNAAEMTFAQALDDIASKTAAVDHHPDAREGVDAFRAKRTPQFNRWLA